MGKTYKDRNKYGSSRKNRLEDELVEDFSQDAFEIEFPLDTQPLDTPETESRYFTKENRTKRAKGA